MTNDKVLAGLGSRRAGAESIALDRTRTDRLLEDSRAKSERHAGILRSAWADFWTLWRFIRAWRDGVYRDVPWKSIVVAVAGVFYFLDPIDIIPDFIPVLGYLDDSVVLAFVARTIHSDLEKFRQW